MKRVIKSMLAMTLCLVFATACGCASVPSPQSPSAEIPDSSQTEVISDADAVSATDGDKRRIELSGDPNDKFIADSNCYAEGEHVIIYFQKGVCVRGDMITIAEKVMADITEVSGLSFEKNYEPPEGYTAFTELYDMQDLDGINSDHEKINLYVVTLGNSIQWAIDNSAILEPEDFDYEATSYQTLYHELTHVAHMRNGVSLGGTLSEGYAVYIAYEAQKANEMPVWSAIQYFGTNDLFDDSIISGGEAAFCHMYDDNNWDYQYGFRFVTFLFEEYGDSAFDNILQSATSQKYSDAYSPNSPEEKAADNEELISIIKENTSEDVFVRFTEWYNESWDLEINEYNEYMNSIGLSW